MPQANIGPALSPGEESDLRREQREVELADAEKAVESIKKKVAGMQETLRTRENDVARLRAELEG